MAVYVYTPTSGYIGSRFVNPFYCGTPPNQQYTNSYYCSGTCHRHGWCSSPLDISMTGSGYIDFWADPIVRSVRVVKRPSNACDPAAPAPWGNIFEVQMYSAVQAPPGSYLASVAFLHVQAAEAVYDTQPVGPLRGITQWARVPAQCENGYCAAADCFSGPHTHIEACGNYFYNSALPCGQLVTSGGAWLYGFNV